MQLDNDTKRLIEEEIKGCFDFFWNESNAEDAEALGYGLTADVAGRPISSLAAVGFSLAAYVIGVERGYITFDEGYERVYKTLKTLEKVDQYKGFFVHFVFQKTIKNVNFKEYSTIDTAILLMGAATAGEFFGKDVKTLTDEMINKVAWEDFVTTRKDRKVFKMAYSDVLWQDNNGWCPATWHSFAEQVMMYFLYAGQKNSDKQLAQDLYFGFSRKLGSYKGENLVYCFGNALFIHQFTGCFIDFSKYVDKRGFNWHKNSVAATLANRQFCIDQKWSKTYHENSWGLTAFEGKHGYKVFGAPPFGFYDKEIDMPIDGSVAPYAALSSIVYTPKESIEALKYFNTLPKLKGKYGFTDSYNFEEEEYFSEAYLGIDKGPTIIMLDNFLYGTTWKYFMQSDVCKRAIEVLEFKPIESEFKEFTNGPLSK